MSYLPANAIQPTPGLAYEAYKYREQSPMFPFAPYASRAAGPNYLSTDGLGRLTIGEPPAVPSNLRGMGGDPISDAVNKYIDSAVQGVINRNWPVFETKLNASMQPLKVLLGLTVVASGLAAVIGYLNYRKGA